MAKMVGLSRNLKLPWLNKAAELVLRGQTEQEIKEELNEYLRFEIASAINIRKTREILMHIWVYENRQAHQMKASALKLIKAYPEYNLVIHWCMMMAAYPVFADTCKLIGKMSEFQDEIILARLKQKLFDEWGERSTLLHSIDKLVATLKALNVMVCDKPGKYHINTHRVSNPKVVAFMVYTIMRMENRAYYTLTDISSSAYFFPFVYKLEQETLFEDSRFAMHHFGGELSVSLNG